MNRACSFFRLILCLVLLLPTVWDASAQRGKLKFSVTLQEAGTNEPVGFATISLTKKGADKPAYYSLSNSEGFVEIGNINPGTYIIKAELLGYKPWTFEKELNENLILGVERMQVDSETLDAARISADLNPVEVKQDTLEYSANYFKSNDTDMLVDLIKKLPGVEVDDDGKITINGETIKKITIDGKTFFLNDPKIASQNIPAKVINKIKLIEKKSEQAEFTGIDDGERETVIDLSFNPGRMRGLFANATVAGGHDIPSGGQTSELGAVIDDWRYFGNAFVGEFTQNNQLAAILSGNNTNNQGATDNTANAMAGMRNAQVTGNGINTSWMAGANGTWMLFGGKMELSANYVYTLGDKYVENGSFTRRYYDAYDLETDNNGVHDTRTQGHRIGIRMKHDFSKNTSLIFEPEFNFGKGTFDERTDFSTQSAYSTGTVLDNTGFRSSIGGNLNYSTAGHLTFRQKILIPGRTFTFRLDYNLSHNGSDGYNQSQTRMYSYDEGEQYLDSLVNQRYTRTADTRSVTGRFTYTEPIGNGFYLQANYNISWRLSESVKDTYRSGIFDPERFLHEPYYNTEGEEYDITYSNNIINRSLTQRIGGSLLYQKKKTQIQLGFAGVPTKTHNETTRRGRTDTYDRTVTNWAPQAMFRHDINTSSNIRINYRGSSSQPSLTQLMPVPDNSNPLRISFGNPYLKPTFQHRLTADYRFTNRKAHRTISVRLNGTANQDPIVNATWRDNGGVQYSMPFNGHNTYSGSLQTYINSPIARSKFQIYDQISLNYNYRSSYTGRNGRIDTNKYYSDGEFDYVLFNEDYEDIDVSPDFLRSITNSFAVTEQLRLTYRSDNFEAVVNGRTRMNNTYVMTDTMKVTTHFNNQVSGRINWTQERLGLTVESQITYKWYMNYEKAQPSETVWTAQISKTVLKRKGIISLRAYDILGLEKSVSVRDEDAYYRETVSNTLGRYIILSFTYRFNDNRNARGGRGGYGGFGGPGGFGGRR